MLELEETVNLYCTGRPELTGHVQRMVGSNYPRYVNRLELGSGECAVTEFASQSEHVLDFVRSLWGERCK